MTRLLSGVALLAVAIAVVWFAPPWIFLAVAEGLVLLTVSEYVGLVRASGLTISTVPVATVAVLASLSLSQLVAGTSASLDVLLLSALVALGAVRLASWDGGEIVGSTAAAVFPAFYLGLPIGAMVAIRETSGGPALFLLMITIVASDTAQYYAGRALGRRLLAPRISPKKTVEGAMGGVIAGGAVLAVAGAWWLPGVPLAMRVALGVALVAAGILGDLFESALKRGAGLKDSSSLIPGHGGMLDRVDALLFAAPVYYVVLKYV